MKVPTKELAQILGLSPGRISQLKSDGIVEPDRAGKYDLAKSVQAYIAFLETGALSPELAAHRAKLIEQQTRRLKIANDRQEAQLVPMADVRHVIAGALNANVQMLEALPGRCAAAFAAMTDAALIHARLKAEIRAARQMMADRFTELAAEAEQQ